MFATVFDNDPSSHLLVAAATLKEYTAGVFAVSPYVVVVITDHVGQEVEVLGSYCNISDTDSVLSTVVNVTQSQQWRVDIGQCPEYTAQVISSSSRLSARVYVAAIVLCAVLSMAGVLLSVHLHTKDLNLRVALAMQEESSRAHKWIIGYCEYERVTVVFVCTATRASSSSRYRIAARSRLGSRRRSAN